MNVNAWRRRGISEPAYRWVRNAMPLLSAIEREAMEARRHLVPSRPTAGG